MALDLELRYARLGWHGQEEHRRKKVYVAVAASQTDCAMKDAKAQGLDVTIKPQRKQKRENRSPRVVREMATPQLQHRRWWVRTASAHRLHLPLGWVQVLMREDVDVDMIMDMDEEMMEDTYLVRDKVTSV